VIVRLLGLGQYRLDDADIALVEKADDAVESAVAAGDEIAFRAALAGLIDRIREVGDPVSDDEFVTSDVIVPDRDTSLADAVAMGAAGGEGLIPG
jgi:hypothetical protein